jgi:hypothetical protein
MQYQIIPLEIGSIVDREVFQSGNMEIKCGLVWKLGSVVTNYKPSFIKNYDDMLKFAENKSITDFQEVKTIKTSYYTMSVNINYHKLIQKLIDCKIKMIEK